MSSPSLSFPVQLREVGGGGSLCVDCRGGGVLPFVHVAGVLSDLFNVH